jgi:hypothetical protein
MPCKRLDARLYKLPAADGGIKENPLVRVREVSMKKLATCVSAALIVLGTAGSADAQWRHGGWGGGWRGGYYGGWGRDYGWGGGGALAAGLIGGALIGSAIAASSPAYGYGYGYPAYGYGYPA